MKRPYQITAVVFILFSAFIAREAMELKFYTALGPGPGFFPFWLSVLMAILAAMMFYNATFKDRSPLPDDFWASRVGYLRMAAIFVAITFAILMMEHIGFVITMLVFYLFLLFTLGRQNLIVTAIVAIAGSFGVFWVFTEVLKVPLPTIGIMIGTFGI